MYSREPVQYPNRVEIYRMATPPPPIMKEPMAPFEVSPILSFQGERNTAGTMPAEKSV